MRRNWETMLFYITTESKVLEIHSFDTSLGTTSWQCNKKLIPLYSDKNVGRRKPR